MLTVVLDLFLFCNLGLISFHDWRERRVSLCLLVFLLIVSFAVLYAEGRILTHSPYLVAGLSGAGIWGVARFVQWRQKRTDVLGSADVILFFILGLLVKPALFPFILSLIGVLGLMSALIYTRLYGAEKFPFCPAICAGIFFTRIYDNDYLKDITLFQ